MLTVCNSFSLVIPSKSVDIVQPFLIGLFVCYLALYRNCIGKKKKNVDYEATDSEIQYFSCRSTINRS